MSKDIPDDLIHAAFFFVDIVGLSNPIISTETQRTKIKILNEKIYNCQTFSHTPKEDLYVLPTGDGMLICFKNGLEQPVKLAIELHKKLKEYNDNALSTETIGTRIGCNTGHVFVVKDVYENLNLWGPGAVLSRRVMDLGDENHILLTSNMANDLFEISDNYKKIIHPIHDYKIKHNEEILVYSAFSENFGNPTPPKKTITNSKTLPKTICENITFNIKLKDIDGITRLEHERIYDFVNDAQEPIYEVYIGIMTNNEVANSEQKIKVIDEEGNDLKISKIVSLTPLSKVFTVNLRRPVFRGGEGREIHVFYESAEDAKFFEHKFFTVSQKFELNFIIPYDFSQPNPRLYLVDENNNKKLIYESARQSKGLFRIIQWKIANQTSLNQRIRLEWSEDIIL